MSRPKGSIIGARPTWTTTATSGIWTLRQAEEMKTDGKWPRGPVAPTSLEGTGSDGEVALTWVAPATTHGTITDYVVEYTPAAGSPTVVATGSTAASYTLTGLTNDTEYTFRVAAVNHTRGDWSSSVAVTPSAAAAEGWDISTASLVRQFSVNTYEAMPAGVFFKPDGTKLYALGFMQGKIQGFSLSTAWDLSSASYLHGFSVSQQDGGPQGLYFAPDGTKAYMCGSGNRRGYQYGLSTAWDISSAAYEAQLNLATATGNTDPTCLFMSPDLVFMYVTASFKVLRFTLATPGNIATASLDYTLSTSGVVSSPQGVYLSPDGTKMYLCGTSDVFQYTLATAWNLSTAQYIRSFSIASQFSAGYGVFFSPYGLDMFACGFDPPRISQYALTPT